METMGLRVRVETNACVITDRLASLPDDLSRGPFQHRDWIAAWLAAHAEAPPRLALALVEAEGGATPLLVLPLMLDLRARTRCWTALDDGVADYNTPMLAPDFDPSAETMRWIWARIVDQLPVGDLIFLEKMPERIGGRRNPLLDLTRVTRSRFLCHPLALDGDFEAMRRRTSGRRSLDRKRRKLERRGRLAFTVASGGEAVASIERLMGWRDHRYDSRPITLAFYRRLLLDTDLARVGVLTLDGEPIAGCFGIVDGGVLRLLVSAFDAAMKNWSPGLLAIDAMIVWAAETGLDTFDFTIGSEPYKFAFGVASEPLWEVRASLGLRGRVLLGLLGVRSMAARLVRRSRAAPVGFVGDRPKVEESPAP